VSKKEEKERCKFQIKLTIREKDGKLAELNQKVYLEVVWEGDRGVLSPSEVKKFDDEWSKKFGSVNYRISKGKRIRLKKNGKNYDFIVKIYEIKKGWFYDKINGVEAEGGIAPAPNSNFTIVYPVSGEGGKQKSSNYTKPRMLWEKNPNEKCLLIKPDQLRWKGPVLVGITIFLIILSVIIYFWKRKT